MGWSSVVLHCSSVSQLRERREPGAGVKRGGGGEGGSLFQCSYVSPSCVRGTTLHNGGFCLLGGGSRGYSVSIISGSPVFATWWGLNAFLWLSVVPSLSFYSVFLSF